MEQNATIYTISLVARPVETGLAIKGTTLSRLAGGGIQFHSTTSGFGVGRGECPSTYAIEYTWIALKSSKKATGNQSLILMSDFLIKEATKRASGGIPLDSIYPFWVRRSPTREDGNWIGDHRSSHPLDNRNQESKVEELSGKTRLLHNK